MQNLLLLLPVLACPVGMGFMLWLLMHIMSSGKQQTSLDAVIQQEGRQRTVAPEDATPPSSPSPLNAIWDCVQMCLNWRVLAGLAIVAVLVRLVAPQIFWGAVPTLLVLICPLSLIVMLFTMSRKWGSAGSCASCEGEPTAAKPFQALEQRVGERSSSSPVKW